MIFKGRNKHLLLYLIAISGFCTGQQRSYVLDSISEPFFFVLDQNSNPSFYSKDRHYHFENGRFNYHQIDNVFDSIEAVKNKSQVDFSLTQLNNKKLLTLNGLGIVIQYDENGFTRLDTSSELRNNFRSNFFTYKDNLFSYGGYGYWSYHANLLFYNDINREWNNYNVEDGFFPEGRAYAYGKAIDNKFIFFGGKMNSGYSNELIEFDFERDQYFKIGTVRKYFGDTIVAPFHEVSIDRSKSLFFSIARIHRKKFLNLIDFENLTYARSFMPDFFKDFNDRYPILKSGDSLYYITSSNNKTYLNAYPTSKILENFSNPTALIDPRDKVIWFTKWFLIAVFSLLLLRVIWVLVKRGKVINNRVLLQANYVNFKSDLLILDDLETDVLNYLLQNQCRCALEDLFKLEVLDQYTLSYKKNLVIKSVEGLSKKLKKQPLISEKVRLKITKDPKDGRRKIIILKGNLFRYEGWFNYLISYFYRS